MATTAERPLSAVRRRAMRVGVTLGILLILVLVVGRFLLGFHSTRASVEAHAAGRAMPYDVWSGVLSTVVRDGSVDYGAALEAEAEIRAFTATLEDHGPRSQPTVYPDARSRLAYYINAYNALTLLGVLDHWPIDSVHDVRGVVQLEPGFGFFYAQRFRIDRRNINLYDLEHRIIRPFGDARIHAAISCASRSCPALRDEAFVPERLHQQLDDATRRFVSNAPHVVVDHEAGEVRLSRIFEWFREDFVAHTERFESDSPDTAPAEPLLRFIHHFADPQMKTDVERASGYTLRFVDYDWSLNRAR